MVASRSKHQHWTVGPWCLWIHGLSLQEHVIRPPLIPPCGQWLSNTCQRKECPIAWPCPHQGEGALRGKAVHLPGSDHTRTKAPARAYTRSPRIAPAPVVANSPKGMQQQATQSTTTTVKNRPRRDSGEYKIRFGRHLLRIWHCTPV